MTSQKTKTSFGNKIKNFVEKLKPKYIYFVEEFIKFPAYMLSHPLKAYEEFKREKRAKVSVAVTFIIILILLNILSFQFSGFEVNDNELKDLNSIAEIFYIIAPIVLFTVANWSVTTLFDGKGKMKEIFLMIGYSLYPMLWATGLGIILSNFLTGEELAFYYLVMSIGAFLMGYLIFMGMISIHEYGLAKCVITLIATVLAAAIIIFMLILFYDLFQKMYGFFYTIYQEISLRDLF
ncbi:MAG TPA: YIP1 family protein [Acholeplasmataceae bacterium]|jgi:hypothetical protein|nr:YIP1 family protein [Acholeplasmataceae bacterium]